jgi:hypothetical protein
MNKAICESCRKRPVSVEMTYDADHQPYRLCKPCEYRVLNKALRPLEFFHLTSLHGPGYYLHDDFYDFDTGTAIQPKVSVTNAESYPFPKLESIIDNLPMLIDYAFVVQFVENDIIFELIKFDEEDILRHIQSKAKYNRAINYRAYELAAKLLKAQAADWIRTEWLNRKDHELLILAEAMVKCLPFDEAFACLTKAIAESSKGKLWEDNLALIYFQNRKTLDWIEMQSPNIINVSASWGILAAASQFNWKTAHKWLETGRPLSLVALDALLYCTTSGMRLNQPFWFRQHPPVLFDPERPEKMVDVLMDYLAKDSVPRVKDAIRQISNNLK